jgi:hypothetical protein
VNEVAATYWGPQYSSEFRRGIGQANGPLLRYRTILPRPCRIVTDAGNLQDATNETGQGVHHFRIVGDTIYLPRSLGALAALKAKTGQVDEAHRFYVQAEGVIDEMLQLVPGGYTESSLLSEMSNTYPGTLTKGQTSQNDVCATRRAE